MKYMVVLALLCLGVSTRSQTANKAIFEKSARFTVEGKIKNYTPGNNNGFITLRTYAVNGRSRDTAIAINTKGDFNCSLYQPFEGDIALMYNDEYADMYISPSEKIVLTIDEDKWLSGDKTTAIHFSGRSAAISKAMIDFANEIRKHTFINNPDMGNKEQGDKGYADVYRERVKEELAFLDTYVTKNKITDKKFIQWSKNKIIYEAGKYIAFYCFAGKMNTTITYPQLMSYVSTMPLLNSEAMHNSVYYDFLRMITTDFEIITNINPLYKDSVKQKGNSSLVAYLDKIDSYSSGIAKELMYYYLYNDNAKNKDAAFNMARFTTVIKEPYLKTLLAAAKANQVNTFTPFNVIDRIKKYPAADSLTGKFTQLLQANKGSYVFIDFWGSWCGPCMSEMPLYPELIEKFTNKPVIFLFLDVDTKKEKVEEVRNKYKLNATFISLNDNETKILNNVLQFSSYPSHFIMDPAFNLVNNSVPGLNAGGVLNTNLVEQIEKTISNK